jgi:hypothetical protein
MKTKGNIENLISVFGKKLLLLVRRFEAGLTALLYHI